MRFSDPARSAGLLHSILRPRRGPRDELPPVHSITSPSNCEQRGWHLDAERLRSLQIERHLDAVYSGLMFAALTTLPHFSVSPAMDFTKSVLVIGMGKPPRSAMRDFILGSARAAFISLLSLSMIFGGVFLGAPMPYQLAASYPGTKSPTGGMSGNASKRVALVTARARSSRARTCSIDETRESNIILICPSR
jgi:hypothetical protein